MNLPEKFEIIIITLSDRAFNGEYEDLSGPEIRDLVSGYFSSLGWVHTISLKLIPDDAEKLKELIIDTSMFCNLIFTTGGTGIGPRDITVETIMPLLTKEIPGVMEFIRMKYGANNPNALLSRGIAGITGNSLIYTLPGSLKAVNEYMTEIFTTLKHTVYMQYGIDSHGKSNF